MQIDIASRMGTMPTAHKRIAVLGGSWGATNPLFKTLFACFDQCQIDYYEHRQDMPTRADMAFFIDCLPESRVAPLQVLFRFEPSVVIPETWQPQHLTHVDVIFTWDDDFIDEQRCFKLNYSYDLRPGRLWYLHASAEDWYRQKTRFLTLINGHKLSFQPGELYSKRLEWIRYMEAQAPDRFDLYGTQWAQPIGLVGGINGRYKLLKKLYRNLPLPKGLKNQIFPHYFSFKPFPSYRGTIQDKIEVLGRYHFAICYENCETHAGYVTEKIWDSLVSGTIPVYLGATNIERYIPKSCFIDARDWKTPRAIYAHLNTISASEYVERLGAIQELLSTSSYFEQLRSNLIADACYQTLQTILARGNG
jgi:hypothetical protein